MVKYVCVRHVDSRLGCVDVFVRVAFFNNQVGCGASMGANESLVFALGEIDAWFIGG